MAHEFKITRRIEFSETDMAGIVHFANFFRYMEVAEHAFLRSLGFSVVMNDRQPRLGFPRVHAEADYQKPLRFEDLVEIHLLVKEKRSRVLTYEFRFNKLDPARPDAPGLFVARGLLTVVCVSHAPDRPMEAVPIPSDLAAKIEAAPAELFK